MAAENDEKLYEHGNLGEQDSIRLLELLPGVRSAALQGRVLEVRLSQNPTFEALSYACGEAHFPKRIEDVESHSYIRITENLYDALQELRPEDDSRVLWVDAVCINQQNLPEKNRQVVMMKDVYQNARRVVVWLGKEAGDEAGGGSVAAMDELERIGRNCKLYGFSEIFPFPRTITDQQVLQNCTELADKCFAVPLMLLFDRAWFERVWTVQEFILAQDLILQCGKRSISYELFSKAIAALTLLNRHPIIRDLCSQRTLGLLFLDKHFEAVWQLIQQRERHVALSSYGPFKRNVYAEEPSTDIPGSEFIRPSSIIEYCNFAAKRKCTDERDRVYGMLGFAHNNLSILPDYESAAEKVWEELAIKTILSGDLTVLHYAGILPEGQRRIRSFAADFGHLSGAIPFRLGGFGVSKFHAATQVPSRVELLPEGLPKLSAVELDVVKDIAPFGSPSSDTPAAVGAESQSNYLATAFGIELEQMPQPITQNDLRQVMRWWLSFHDVGDQSEAPFETISQLTLLVNKAGPFIYPGEAFESALARTLLANNALQSTQELIGPEETGGNMLLHVYFVLFLLSHEVPQAGAESRIFVPDYTVALHMGQRFKFGTKIFAHEGVTDYEFPSPNPPDAVIKHPDGLEEGLMEIVGPLKGKLKMYKEALSMALWGRSVFVTSTGLIGLGPKTMQIGDEVVIFEGVQTPFLLRKAPEDVAGVSSGPKEPTDMTIRRELVGECYVHGAMEGEMLGATMTPESASRRIGVVLV